MSYLVIARKYRPQLFSDVIGQEHITTTLTRAIDKGRLAHAYLFAGPRGVGKTTTARILAKSVNCEKGPTSQPCNVCSDCKEITDGVHLDVIEIDGASNRGIDDVRELRERVRYSPARGRRKVYIIDEVHMLTTEAFNALLKTLEEPPDHALFVFATTEPHKVPSTILSRCQRFDFRLISRDEIIKHLKWITEREGVEVDGTALALIARRAAGCLRDAQSLLDQLIAFGADAGETGLDQELVKDLLGLVDDEVYFAISAALFRGELGKALAEFRGLLNQGYDLGELTRGFIGFLGSLILIKLESRGLTGEESASGLEQRAREELPDVTADDILRASEILTLVEREMTRSTQPELLLELALVKIARMGKTVQLGEILGRLDEIAAGAGARIGPVAPEETYPQPDLFAAPSPSEPSHQPVETEEEAPDETGTDKATAAAAGRPSGPIDLDTIRDRWHEFIDSINNKRGSVGACLDVAELVSFAGGTLTLGFDRANDFHRERVEDRKAREMIEKAFEEFFGHPVRIKCKVVEKAEAENQKGSNQAGSRDSKSFDREPIIDKAVELLDLERLMGG